MRYVIIYVAFWDISNSSKKTGQGISYNHYMSSISGIGDHGDIRLVEKLLGALQVGDVKGVRRALKKRIAVNEDIRFDNEEEKMTALHYAAKKGMVEIVREILVTKTCDPNKPTPFDQSTPLHLVCKHCDGEQGLTITQDLLCYGADPNMYDYAGRSPLFIASLLGRARLVQLLLTSGANINAVCEADECPEAVRRLQRSAEMSEKDKCEMFDPFKGNSPLIQACREHHVEVVEELLANHCDCNVRNATGNTALHVAAKSETLSTYKEQLTRAPIAGSPNIAKLLISKGSSLNERNKFGDTALIRAADGIGEIFNWNIDKEEKVLESKNFCDVIETLVKAGADVSLRYGEARDETVLHALLASANKITQVDSQLLTQKYQNCIHLVLLAGAHVSPELAQVCGQYRSTQYMLPVVTMAITRPWNLKRLCKISVRHHLRQPLTDTVTKLDMPVYLQQYLLLEAWD